ncbi:hypothetical protein EST38_g13278 [Candolleomyces aberdarensis]|uniref:Uncharacterized protein n=1 Tax=Candolleomyces aberdarensis TaxID=2316362 RepID=A0A4Q2D1F0_9AGAR|nr:hypothetical protein EST38_g13278 [Candolleomyces aberdarensis]
MVGKAWGSRRQCSFLRGRRQEFAASQGDRSLTRQFWPNLVGDFFAIWKNQEIENDDFTKEAEEDAVAAATSEGKDNKNGGTKAKGRRTKVKPPRIPPVFASHDEWVADRTRKLHNWFYNHLSSSRQVKPAVTLSVDAAPVLGGKGLTEDQMYSKKYYHDRVKPLVDAEISANAADAKTQISIRAKLTRQCYEQESEEVKLEIQREKEADERKRRETLEMLQSLTRPDGEKEYTPEEYARYQEAAGDLIECFFEALAPRTGWAWTVLGGGPQAGKDNGKIGVVSFHRGATQDGLKFSGAVEGFDNKFVVPFGQYCHRVFPEEVRLRRAVMITDTAAGREALPIAGRGVGRLVYSSQASGLADVAMGLGTARDDGPVPSISAQCDVNAIQGIVGECGPLPDDTFKRLGKPEQIRLNAQGAFKETVRLLMDGVEVPEDANPFVEEAYTMGDMANVEDRAEILPVDPTALLPAQQPCVHHTDVPHPSPPAVYQDRRYEGRGPMDEVLLPPADDLRVPGMVFDVSSNGASAAMGPQVPPHGIDEPPPHGIKESGGSGHAGLEDKGGSDIQGAGGSDKNQAEGMRGGKARKRTHEEVHVEPDHAPVVEREKRSRRGYRELDEWVGFAERYLQRGVDDEKWSRCVALWVQLEKTALSTTSRLTESGLRPSELAKWVSSRKWDSDPVLDNMADYAQRWLKWWLAMQPASRKVGGQDLPAPLDDGMKKDIASLKKAGANGFVVLLVGLKWWAPLREQDGWWGAVVEDVVQCLETFVH